MSAREETELLDRIEDAELDLKHAKCVMRRFIVSMCLSSCLWALGIVSGVWGTFHHVDTGAIAAGGIAPGIIGSAGSAMALGMWLDGHAGPAECQKQLRRAQRKYRDYLSK